MAAPWPWPKWHFLFHFEQISTYLFALNRNPRHKNHFSSFRFAILPGKISRALNKVKIFSWATGSSTSWSFVSGYLAGFWPVCYWITQLLVGFSRPLIGWHEINVFCTVGAPSAQRASWLRNSVAAFFSGRLYFLVDWDYSNPGAVWDWKLQCGTGWVLGTGMVRKLVYHDWGG